MSLRDFSSKKSPFSARPPLKKPEKMRRTRSHEEADMTPDLCPSSYQSFDDLQQQKGHTAILCNNKDSSSRQWV